MHPTSPTNCQHPDQLTFRITQKGHHLAQKINTAFQPWQDAINANAISEGDVLFLLQLPNQLDIVSGDQEHLTGTISQTKLQYLYHGFLKGYVRQTINRLEALGLLRIEASDGNLSRFTMRKDWIVAFQKHYHKKI